MQGPDNGSQESHDPAAYGSPQGGHEYAHGQQALYSGNPQQGLPSTPVYQPVQQEMPVQGGYQRQPCSATLGDYSWQPGSPPQGYQPPPVQRQPNPPYQGYAPMQAGDQNQLRAPVPAAIPQEASREPQPVQRQSKPQASRLPLRMRRLLLVLCSVACVMIMLFSGLKIVSYYGDYVSSEQGSAMLREAYYEHVDEEATPAPAASTPVPTMAPEAVPSPSSTPRAELQALAYPNNPFATVRSRFKKIQRQNEDIIGWLTIDGVLDEAVVQRDNSYYLTRDYRGYHNSNGALFLDEEIGLSTRPYTLMIYGHNMKTGAMFGSLRHYEHLYFYKENPFITFDTAYEDGRYVIVAVGSISTDVKNWTFVNFASLLSNRVDQRQAALKALMNRSIFGHSIEVAVEDQLLVLLTCVGDETERRVVVARRIRPGESEEELHRLVHRSWEKQ